MISFLFKVVMEEKDAAAQYLSSTRRHMVHSIINNSANRSNRCWANSLLFIVTYEMPKILELCGKFKRIACFEAKIIVAKGPGKV
jgi:hypothetical protein